MCSLSMFFFYLLLRFFLDILSYFLYFFLFHYLFFCFVFFFFFCFFFFFFFFVFFFSSRRRHTRWNCDWSSTCALPILLSERSSRSQQFFSTSAGQWDRMRQELFGRRADVALLGLLDESWVVADLGCGTGAVTQTVAPFVERVVAVDESSAMLTAARKRLTALENVDIRNGRLEALPIADGEADVTLLFLVLHYVADPERVIDEAVRILKPHGRLLVLDMMPHERQDLRQTMGHVWQGFDRAVLGELLTAAGLEHFRYHPLPADPEAKGPLLFTASATRSAVAAKSGKRRKSEQAPLMKSA